MWKQWPQWQLQGESQAQKFQPWPSGRVFEGKTKGSSIQHPIDLKSSLTIGDLKEITLQATQGKLEKVNVKIDGGPLFFTCDAQTGEVFVAKEDKDLLSGGVPASGMRERYPAGSPVEHVGEAFAGAAEILQKAVSGFDVGTLEEIFGPTKNNFYSIEVVYPNDQRVFGYDGKHVVFHPNPYKYVDYSTGEVITEYDDIPGLDKLMQNIIQKDAATRQSEWKIHAPMVMQLRDISSGGLGQEIISELEQLQADAGVGDDATIPEFIAGLAQVRIDELGIQEPTGALAKNLAGVKGAPTIVQLKKLVPSEQLPQVEALVADRDNIRLELLASLDEVFNRLAIGIMKAIENLPLPARVQHPEKIKSAVALANSSALEGNPLQARMKRQANRLGNPEDMVPMEGIVFFYKGQAYKFTGQFGPANQLIGMLRKLGLGSDAALAEARRRINEGGSAFTNDRAAEKRNVQRFRRETWLKEKEYIFDILEEVGCERQTAHPPWMSKSAEEVQRFYVAGSTGKKDDSGDADIVAVYRGTRDELMPKLVNVLAAAAKHEGAEPPAVAKIGEDVSFAYPVKSMPGVYIQVDINCASGEEQYNWKTWTHWGATPGSKEQSIPGSGISRFKGALRAFLLESVLEFLSKEHFPGQQNDIDKTGYSLNVGKGLFKSTKTRKGKKPGAINKTWSELYRGNEFGDEGEPITLDPDAAIERMFGPGHGAYDARSLEDVVELLKTSERFTPAEKHEIVEIFLNKMRSKVADSSKWSRVAPSQEVAASIYNDVEEYIREQIP
jgi:hypothetical protein